MKVEDFEQILVEYLKFRTDSNGYAVINVEDFLKYFRFSYERLKSDDNHDHYYEWVIDKSGYKLKCKKCGEIFFEVITNED